MPSAHVGPAVAGALQHGGDRAMPEAVAQILHGQVERPGDEAVHPQPVGRRVQPGNVAVAADIEIGLARDEGSARAVQRRLGISRMFGVDDQVAASLPGHGELLLRFTRKEDQRGGGSRARHAGVKCFRPAAPQPATRCRAVPSAG
jgi:hypothetical protein